jgi:hypothetical protein
LDLYILKFQKDYRLSLPEPLVKQVHWIKGNHSLEAWLLMGSSGRCRLLDQSAIDGNQQLQTLRAKIETEQTPADPHILEFDDAALVALPFRLLPVQISAPNPTWRLGLPKPIAGIMQLRPGQSELAALLVRDHIEFWTIEMLRLSVSTPLDEII